MAIAAVAELSVLDPFAPVGRPWHDGWMDETATLSVDAITDAVQQVMNRRGESEDEGQSKLVQLAQNGDEEAVAKVLRQIRDILQRERLLTAGMDEASVVGRVFDYLYGFRELAPFFHDPDIEEIQVNRADSIFVVRNGRLERADVCLRDELTLERFLFPRLFTAIGQSISRERPSIEHVRADGVRLSATMPPRSAHATLVVRKHNRLFLDRGQWATLGSTSPRLLDVLGSLVRWRVSELISGPTNSGKTTLLRLLVGYTPENMRWVTLATDRELHLTEAYPTRNIAEMELGGRGEIADLFRIVLRYSPIAVVLEEIRNGAEAETMLQTVQRGHGGSLSTVHVTRPEQIAFEVAKMALEGRSLDPTTLRLKWREVAAVFPVVVQMAADPLVTGRRLVEEIGQYIDRGENEPPVYEPVCVWRPDGDTLYGDGGWHWVNTFQDKIVQQVVRNGGRPEDILVPPGTIDRWRMP